MTKIALIVNLQRVLDSPLLVDGVALLLLDSAQTGSSSKDGLRMGSCDQHLTSKLDVAFDLQKEASQCWPHFFLKSASRTSSDRPDLGRWAA